MFAILGLGFLVGMQHALEADHVAAVSSIAARRSEVADIVRHGLTWGLGHTLTLFVFAGAAILLGHAIPEHISQPLETAVGIMLVGLGAHLLWRLWRDRIHFHWHRHGDDTDHLHLHSHVADGVPHASSEHAHTHGFPVALAPGRPDAWFGGLGGPHRAGGHAGGGPLDGVLFVLLFGIGSMVGMGALSAVIAVPLVVSAHRLTWANRALQVAVGLVTSAIGLSTVYAAVFAR